MRDAEPGRGANLKPDAALQFDHARKSSKGGLTGLVQPGKSAGRSARMAPFPKISQFL